MKKHINIIFLIIVGLAAIAVLGYCFWQLQIEQKTFNWQKFAFVSKNKPIVYEELKPTMDTSDWLYFDGRKEYGISFKYPKDWEVKQMLSELVLRPKKCPDVYTGYGNDKTQASSILITSPAIVDKEIVSVDELLSYYRTLEHEDIFKKFGEYKFDGVIWNNNKSMRVIAEYKNLISEIFIKEDCVSFKDVAEIWNNIFTTLKFYK